MEEEFKTGEVTIEDPPRSEEKPLKHFHRGTAVSVNISNIREAENEDDLSL